MVHEFVSGRAWPRERTGSQGTGEALDPRRRARSADLETLLVSRGRQVVIARGPMTTIDEVYCFGRLFSTCDVCISDVRMALGDAGQEIIKTVPRRGYLLAPLERHRRPAAKVRRVPRPAIPNRPSIAVCPSPVWVATLIRIISPMGCTVPHQLAPRCPPRARVSPITGAPLLLHKLDANWASAMSSRVLCGWSARILATPDRRARRATCSATSDHLGLLSASYAPRSLRSS